VGISNSILIVKRDICANSVRSSSDVWIARLRLQFLILWGEL